MMLRFFFGIIPFIAHVAFAASPEIIGKPHPWQMNLQTAASPMMEGITAMHDFLLIVIAGIALIVAALLSYVIYRFRAAKNPVPSKTMHNTLLECLWTVIPCIIVAMIAVPSYKLMREMERPHDPEMTVKVIGKQWYWTYEYPGKGEQTLSFDSRLLEGKDLKPGDLRLLSVDHAMVVPVDTTVQLLITAADVLHSFAVPSLGIKKDAVPGRINETWFKIHKKGVYYGQCSELCGERHGYMPIAVHAISKEEFDAWHKQKLLEQ